MKSIVCEMCGSHDMIKTNDHYVCQSCGTKFTLEEARKLIVEGVVKIDNTERLDNLFEAARNAKSIGNYEQAKRFYTEILTLEPNSWEATYPAYKKGQLNVSELARVCDISRTTAYKYIAMME